MTTFGTHPIASPSSQAGEGQPLAAVWHAGRICERYIARGGCRNVACNGWPAGIISPVGGHFIGIGNEDAFIRAVQDRTKREREAGATH